MKRSVCLFTLWLSLCGLTIPASAGVVFSDFPIEGTDGGAQVSGSASASDSFTLLSPVVLGTINFGAWTIPGDTVSSIGWEIGSTFFGSNYGSGTATITADSPVSTFDGYQISQLSFALPGIVLPAGTYYLTLQNAAATGGDAVWWDRNLSLIGSGVSAEEFDGSSIHADTTPSTFQVVSAAPEPSTGVLLACGLAFAAWRRRVAGRVRAVA